MSFNIGTQINNLTKKLSNSSGGSGISETFVNNTVNNAFSKITVSHVQNLGPQLLNIENKNISQDTSIITDKSRILNLETDRTSKTYVDNTISNLKIDEIKTNINNNTTNIITNTNDINTLKTNVINLNTDKTTKLYVDTEINKLGISTITTDINNIKTINNTQNTNILNNTNIITTNTTDINTLKADVNIF